jgi:hypothetical protein
MQQREDVAKKYEAIYELIDMVVAAVIKAFPGPPREVYARLKMAAPGAWVTYNWIWTQGKKPSQKEQQEYVDAHFAEPVEWSDYGVRKSGPRIDSIRASEALFAKAIAERLAGCDLVFDLGCGWGHRMVDVHLAGLHAQFIGGDRSPASGRIIASLASVFKDGRFGWFQFDFLKPDFSAVAAAPRKIGVYSIHAIEQVEILGPAVFDALLRRFPDVPIHGVHIEPVAFQIDPAREKEFLYAQGKRYNTDLYEVLRTHPGLELTEVLPDIHDLGDSNTSSLIAWTRTP